ncbi:MAG: Mut7-C RNAse domain-containing protein [Kiloniellaceae bacterium]
MHDHTHRFAPPDSAPGTAAGPGKDGHCGPVKLLCDEMLQGLGRWLRAAGYDTAIAGRGLPDRGLLRRALVEGRVVLTCDRELAARTDADGRVVTLSANGLDATARELRDGMGIDWLHAPFTRCLVDNAVLRPAARIHRAGVPPQARALGVAINACPACGRVYWPGSHVRRMRARLESWQRPGPSSR